MSQTEQVEDIHSWRPLEGLFSPSTKPARNLNQLLAAFDSYANPSSEQLVRIGLIREQFKACATALYTNCPEGQTLQSTLSLLHEVMALATDAVMKEPNPFYSNNRTLRAKFMSDNPDRWQSFMKAAGLTTPYEGYKAR